MATAEFKAALRIVWIAIGVVLLCTLLAPWVLSARQIAAATPKCEWKARYRKECFLCGMTTAFIAIRHGRFREAQRSNRGSLPLYSGFVLNEVLLLATVFTKACSAS
jgi:hypothetical protein